MLVASSISALLRHLCCAEGGLRSDLRLIELDEKLLDSVKAGDVVIKGATQEDAVLCTSDKTFALKVVETTNTLLLLPPQGELDEDFAAIPSLPTPGRDASAIRDVGLQTQLQKSAAAKDYPPLTATATVGAHLELVEIMPCLDKLPELLGRPYNFEHDEEQQQAAAGQGVDDMDTDWPASVAAAGPGSTALQRQQGPFTLEQLLQRVQASCAELLAELQRLQAVQFGPHWRLVDSAYLGSVLEMLLVSAMERGWSLQEPMALQDVLEALQPEGYKPVIIQHCLHVYGRSAAQDASAGADAATASSSGSSNSDSYVLDERQVCLHYARKLLRQQAVWLLHAFLPAWEQEVPGGCWSPQEEMLAGEALVLQADPLEGISEARVRHLPASQLPSTPSARFAALFAAQPRWTREQLDPYLAGLKVPGQTVEILLLKYARASQRSPTDATVVFVAR